MNEYFFFIILKKRPESAEVPGNTQKHHQKPNWHFFEKRQFFEEKVKNGDAEVLFTPEDALVQKLDWRRICLMFLQKQSFFSLFMSLNTVFEHIKSISEIGATLYNSFFIFFGENHARSVFFQNRRFSEHQYLVRLNKKRFYPFFLGHFRTR